MLKNLYPVKENWKKKTYSELSNFEKIYNQSISNSDEFWSVVAKRIVWRSPWKSVSNCSYNSPVKIEWFKDATLNVNDSCVDRHAKSHPKRIAFKWIPEDENSKVLDITYAELKKQVCKLSSALNEMGVRKGDRVTLYLPMVPEAVYSMLACARIGAVHSVIFAGFSPNSIRDRIEDCRSDWVITADEGVRGGKFIPLKKNVDEALGKNSRVKKVLVLKRSGNPVSWNEQRDIWYHDIVSKQPEDFPSVTMSSEDPLFILYTSGSTGKPKGVLHTTGGYLVYAAYTHEIVFDYTDSDLYWCAADIGWVTGHSYIVYGPLANGATSLMYEGLPTYPDSSRMWKIVETHKVNILYTAPTLIRALMRDGDKPVLKHDRSSLRILGSVGEPINPEAWAWYYDVIGNATCPIVDTWWQTETGGILISPLPGIHDLKPGSAMRALPGINPCILNDQGQELKSNNTGHLCLKKSWPGQMRTVFGDHSRFEQTYFSQFPGYYYAGDECHIDKDGDIWVIGRADDVINVSGHRLGSAEIESAIVAHPDVTESAIVGYPHAVKGQGIYAFVTLKNGVEGSEKLKAAIMSTVKEHIGSLAKPDIIQWAPALPKTRSGKIMRRILKKIAANDLSNLGDISTLADPAVVESLKMGRSVD